MSIALFELACNPCKYMNAFKIKHKFLLKKMACNTCIRDWFLFSHILKFYPILNTTYDNFFFLIFNKTCDDFYCAVIFIKYM